jgi:hypothetical protein
MTTTINKTWFKNQLKKGNLLVKCTGKYTDDYAYDNATNFSTKKEFTKKKLKKIGIFLSMCLLIMLCMFFAGLFFGKLIPLYELVYRTALLVVYGVCFIGAFLLFHFLLFE